MWFGIAIAVLLGIIWIAKPAPGAPLNGSAISTAGSFSASGNSFDFGAISMSRGKVKTTFTFKNTSSSSIAISRVYTSCMCTNASLITSSGRVGPFGMPGHGFVPSVDKQIPAGEDAKIEVVFDPAAHGPAGIGPIERSVYVETENSSPLVFNIKANVTP